MYTINLVSIAGYCLNENHPEEQKEKVLKIDDKKE